MTGTVFAPRYSHEDFETASVRSAAPSYVSDVPSYHSTAQQHETQAVPQYTPRGHRSTASTSTMPSTRQAANSTANTNTSSPSRARHQRQQSVGLPPIPPRHAPGSMPPNLPNFRLPTWGPSNALAARHYHNVANSRVSDGRYGGGGDDGESSRGYISKMDSSRRRYELEEVRPLEDPYMVGEVAAADARRARLARESGDDILIEEDKHWDWMLSQLKDWDERDRSWKQFKRNVEMSPRKNLLRRIRGM